MYFTFDGEARTPKSRAKRIFSGCCFANDRDDAESSVCNEIGLLGWEISNLSFIEVKIRPYLLPRGEIIQLETRNV